MRNTQEEYLKDRINELATYNKRDTRSLYRKINEFKKG
jgi:hypothetical protein